MSAERFLDVLSTTALQAGAVARRMQPGVVNLRKEGATPEARALTIADLACQDVLLLALRGAFPEAAVDAEEEPELVAETFPREETGRPLVILDPIDGTLNYLEGSDDYAVMAAWCEAGRYEASVVQFPALGRTFLARAGAGAWELRNGERVAVDTSGAPRVVTVTRGIPTETCERIAGAGYEVVRTRCSAVDGVAPMLGRAAAALCVGRPGRRRAAGYLITHEAGGVCEVFGRPWDRQDPRAIQKDEGFTLLASRPEIAAELAPLVSEAP